MPSYRPKEGTPYTEEDAQVVVPELMRLARQNGGELTKTIVKEAARSRRSPLHRYVFNDDVETAAEKWYNLVAGRLLRSFEVVWRQGGQETTCNLMEYVVSVRSEATVPPDEDDEMLVRPGTGHRPRVYVPATTVMDNTPQGQAYQQQLLARAEQDLEAWRRRYAKIENLVDFRTRFGRTFRRICELFPELMED